MNKDLIRILAILNDKSAENTDSLAFLNDIDLTELYKITLPHGISPAVYHRVNDYCCGNEKHRTALDMWSRKLKQRIISMLYLLKDLQLIIHSFDRNKVDYVLIKGLSISRFYPNPLYRTMGDIDFFVSEKDYTRAVSILEEMGYSKTEEDSNPLHISFARENRMVVELHKNLIHTGYLGSRNYKNWYEHIWSNKQTLSFSGIPFNAMSAEDELINQIIHFACHFVYFGTKLKHIYEIALMIHSNPMDWSYIEETLLELGFLKFASLLFSICKTFFNADVPEHLSNERKRIQRRFICDLFEYFTVDMNDYRGWRNLINNYRYMIKKAIYKPIIWGIELKSQYHLHGFRLKLLIFNAFRNTRVILKKIHIIRNYELIVQ